MRLRPYIIMLLLLSICLAPKCAVAKTEVGGSILYGAGAYRAEVDGKEAARITSQYGQVSLFSNAQGLIGSERLGKYRLMLGYEFNVLDPTITESGIKDPATQRIEAGKVLYQADFMLAPGGLPFRLTGYARDVKRSAFEAGSKLPLLPVGIQSKWGDSDKLSLLMPDVLTDINNGTQAEMGLTLLLGIRNGTYLGDYRDVLSTLPRLLIDFKQVEVKDLSRDSNQDHYRQRDLAFISLNKKDNWVHLRRHDYVNYLDSTQNYETTQVMVGTVDHVLARQWINLTNWIKISGDLSFTSELWRHDEAPTNSHNVNLFVVTQRPDLKVSALTSFERTTQDLQKWQTLDIPFYFYYTPNRDSLYRGGINTLHRSESILKGGVADGFRQSDHRSTKFDFNPEFYRTGAILFKPSLKLEVRDDETSQGLSEKLILEWSKKKGLDPLLWTAGYYIASSQTSDDTDSSSVYVEQSLYGQMERDLKRSLRAGLRASIRQGSGQSENNMTEDLTDRVEIETTGGTIQKGNDRFFAYHGQVYLEHIGEIFSNRIELIAEGINTENDNRKLMEARHELKMRGQMSQFILKSTLARGTEVRVSSIDLGFMDVRTEEGSDYSWSSDARYIFDPDRRLRLTLLGSARGFSRDQGHNLAWTGSEKLQYFYYANRGRVLKLAEFDQEFGVEETNEQLPSGRDRTLFLRMSAAVYPTTNLYAKFTSELLWFSPSGAGQVTNYAESGMNFDKLQVALSYARGDKDAEGTLAAVTEERWNLKVKKIF